MKKYKTRLQQGQKENPKDVPRDPKASQDNPFQAKLWRCFVVFTFQRYQEQLKSKNNNKNKKHIETLLHFGQQDADKDTKGCPRPPQEHPLRANKRLKNTQKTHNKNRTTNSQTTLQVCFEAQVKRELTTRQASKPLSIRTSETPSL